MKTIKRLFKNRKGIDTILAALLMVVIVVVASVMVYAWSTGLLGSLLVTPQTGKEALSMEQYTFSNTTRATLYIRNTGTASITFASYYVKDPSGNQYSKLNWNSGTPPAPAPVAVNGLATTTIDIGAICCGAPQGSTFTFSSGVSYTIIIVTTRNNQFTFTVVKS